MKSRRDERAWGRRTILIADGDRAFRRSATRALAAAGFQVREAACGREALDAAVEGDVALVVLEVHLQNVNGYEVCRRLRDLRGEALPILFVSRDRTEASDRIAGILLGADDYLAKPVAPDELVARVRRHLQRAAALAPKPTAGLAARETEVLTLLTRGLGPVEIGDELSISPKTVATHVEHIYSKLSVHTRAQAVAKAFQLALVS
jgi:DNA-binding NarL/FixJ family response regulator